MCPERAVLGDLNHELIDTYRQVRDHASKLEKALRGISVDPYTYNEVKASQPTDAFDRAVRFIYLNRTCYGGLYRTNQRGIFNVPYGGGSRTHERLYRDHLLIRASAALRGEHIEIRHEDFEVLLDLAKAGDVAFCDPTYRSAGRGRFDRYGPNVFSWSDQQRLLTAAARAKSRGVVIVIMNIDDPDVKALYREAAAIVSVARKKSIGNPAKDSSWHQEIIALFGDGSQDWGELVATGRTDSYLRGADEEVTEPASVA
jgi:DNA adenine methylase